MFQRYEDHDDGLRAQFQSPGERSALRRAGRSNPRCLPCPTCGRPDRLTPADRAHGYQCDECADRDEGRSFGMDG